MKKIAAVLIISLLIVSAGCSSPASVKSSAPPTAAPTSAAPAETATQPAETATPEETPAASPTEEPTLEPTEPAATPDPLCADDLQLVVEDEYFCLQTNVQDILDVMGEGCDTKTVDGPNGKEKDYVYPDITLKTYSEQGMDVVFAAEFTGDAFDTARGVHVGSAADDVTAAFGTGYYEENGAYVYTFDGKKADADHSSITFAMTDGAVSSVTLHNAGEIQ